MQTKTPLIVYLELAAVTMRARNTRGITAMLEYRATRRAYLAHIMLETQTARREIAARVADYVAGG